MDLKPLPIEELSKMTVNTGKRRAQKQVKRPAHNKLRKRIEQQPSGTNTQSTEQVLQGTCKKILKYLEGNSSSVKLNSLEHQLHRAVLALQKEKRAKIKRKKK